MAKLTRVPAKVFADSAAATEIGQFGSAVAGAKLETSDVAVIQALSAWEDGWSEALVSGNRYPALQEMNGLLKVMSYQSAYALQEGIPEYDSATTYYIGSIVKKTGTFELYGSLTNDNVGQALTDAVDWQLLCDLSSIGNVFTADTSNMPILANNGSDANNDIDFSAGFCYDLTTFAKITNVALTKRLDATFTAGTNQGGLDTGSKAISTWYHCFAISKADGTADFLFSLSATAPTMPTTYINKRRIGSIRTDASGNIIGFIQNNNHFTYKSPILDISTTFNTTSTLCTLSVPSNCRVRMNIILPATASSGAILYISEVAQLDIPATIPAITAKVQEVTYTTAYPCLDFMTNALSQIRAVGDSTIGTVSFITLGYIDLRGVN